MLTFPTLQDERCVLIINAIVVAAVQVPGNSLWTFTKSAVNTPTTTANASFEP